MVLNIFEGMETGSVFCLKNGNSKLFDNFIKGNNLQHQKTETRTVCKYNDMDMHLENNKKVVTVSDLLEVFFGKKLWFCFHRHNVIDELCFPMLHEYDDMCQQQLDTYTDVHHKVAVTVVTEKGPNLEVDIKYLSIDVNLQNKDVVGQMMAFFL